MKEIVIAFAHVFAMMAPWLVFGFLMAGIVAVLIPNGFFAEAFGGRDWLAMPAMAVIGFPMYVCSTASIPIAASFVLKGVSPGAAFVFLMVGPAMNAMSVTTVASLIGRRATVAYVATIVVGAILCGCAVNLFADAAGDVGAVACASHELGALHWASAAFLAAMMVYNLVRPVKMGHAKHAHPPCCKA